MDLGEVEEQLRSLGVSSGDVLYLRASLSKMRLQRAEIETVFLRAVLNVIGDTGTIIVPAFVQQYPRWKRRIPVSDSTTPSNAGALASLVLAQPGSVRSGHPTHSFAGYGAKAQQILSGHSGTEPCFGPMRHVVNLNGLMMVLGCTNDSPGFSTVHLAQYDLGLSRQHYLKFLYHVRFKDTQDRVSFFNPIESPGCSKQFGRFYGMYPGEKRGFVGQAEAISVRARHAYRLEKSILSEDPAFTLCKDPRCLSCAARGYNKSGMAKYFASKLVGTRGR
ncbi:MAG: AAC(3) family N-acetyltransferase [Rhizobiaceae bacterium]|nr:AAC(3) family N-acetyltransferase [Rhizobiaceae bacterium]